jgi:hypothetical protein
MFKFEIKVFEELYAYFQKKMESGPRDEKN